MSKYVKQIVMLSVLIAIQVILSSYLSLNIGGYLKISFSFIPIALMAMFYGPIYAGVCAAIGNFIGYLLHPMGPYFPGFEISAALVGVIYGLFLYKDELKIKNIVLATSLVEVLIHLGLNSLWLYMLMGNTVFGILPVRAIKVPILIIVSTIIIYLINEPLVKKMKPMLK